jgi:hypothetical protein
MVPVECRWRREAKAGKAGATNIMKSIEQRQIAVSTVWNAASQTHRTTWAVRSSRSRAALSIGVA